MANSENVSGDGEESDDSCVFLSFVRPSISRNQILETIVLSSSDDDEEPGASVDTSVNTNIIEQAVPITETDDQQQYQLKLTWNSSIYCAESSDGLDGDRNSQRKGK